MTHQKKSETPSTHSSKTPKNSNERLHALNLLIALLTERISLSQSMNASTPVTSLTKELSFGFCRHYFRLEAIADVLVKKRPKERDIWILLLLGLYQLHYMHKPDYAVVQETVSLLDKVKKIWAKGLINAVLRTFCRQQKEIISSLAHNEQFIYGLSQQGLNTLKKVWPHDWHSIALAQDMHPPMTLRVNQRKKSVEDYLKSLQEIDMEAQVHPLAPFALILKNPCDVSDLPGFSEGWVSVQDAAAQLAATLLSLKPGLRVLDACCAPGGKTCHIVESEPELKECIALDVNPNRLKRVSENLKRLDLQATVLEGDALTPHLWWNGQFFDRILLDAPCSATGVIRRHPDIKLLRTKEDIRTITSVQEAMLNSLWPLLAKGGLMVYATCSIMPEENEKQIATFLEHHPDCAVIEIQHILLNNSPMGVQILPGEQTMDGFFYSVLLKDPNDS